jgi:hypothetical protein
VSIDDTYGLNVLTVTVSRKQHTEGTYDAPLWLVAYTRVGLGTMLSTRAAEVGYKCDGECLRYPFYDLSHELQSFPFYVH